MGRRERFDDPDEVSWQMTLGALDEGKVTFFQIVKSHDAIAFVTATDWSEHRASLG